MKMETWGSLVLAAGLGVLYKFVAFSIWGIYVASAFAPGRWLLDIFGSGTVLFWIALYTHDTLVNVLLAAPFAAVLVLFRGLNNWLCVCLAIMAGLVTSYWGAEWSNFPWLARAPMWWTGLAMELFSLPIAFVAIRTIRRNRSGTQPSDKARGRAAAELTP